MHAEEHRGSFISRYSFPAILVVCHKEKNDFWATITYQNRGASQSPNYQDQNIELLSQFYFSLKFEGESLRLIININSNKLFDKYEWAPMLGSCYIRYRNGKETAGNIIPSLQELYRQVR